jgi:hypothetical protein
MTPAPRHPKLTSVAPVGLTAGAACAAAAVWALWPDASTGVPSAQEVLASIQPMAAPGPGPSGPVAFDPAAFHTPLWIAAFPEPEPAQTPPSPPPPPLRATLLAIARDASHALVHDLDADRIATLRVGDQIQGRVVSLIEPSRVTLTLDGQPQTLDLGYSVGAARQSPVRRDVSAVPGREDAP